MKFLFHSRGIKEHYHAIYSRSSGRSICNTDRQKTHYYFLWLEFSRIALMILARVLFGISIFTLRKDPYHPVVWNMMLMLWHVFVNSEDLAIGPSSWTRMNATFLSWFLNIVTRFFRISRGGRLLLYGNPKGYEVAENIATKFKINLRILSTLENQSIYEVWNRKNFLMYQWLDMG